MKLFYLHCIVLFATILCSGAKPLKIFLMAGQSNMEGHAEIRTIDFLGEDADPERAALLKKFKPDGKTLVTRDDVWVMSNGAFFDKLQPGLGARNEADKLGNKIGPEYAFGYFMGEALEEQILLINDLRKELKAPDMKVVVGVMGINGPRNEIGKQKEIRDGHRFVNTVPEFKGNVKAIETAHLLHPKVLELNLPGGPPGGIPRPGVGLYPERDITKNPITPEEQALLNRATSNLGYHYYGEGRFFVLLGKSFAETMLELMGTK